MKAPNAAVPGRQSFGDEEAFDSRRTSDDRQAIAVADQLDVVIHHRLLKWPFAVEGEGGVRGGGRAGMPDAPFACPDLTTFCRLDELEAD
ncbi:hypothetical protein AB0L47_21880 [Streptomyces bobili]|uniref:hypothetical protein n=1 Tax=Streptomyces bobili TaxID=67280 RepID=UPI00343DED73